MEYIELLEYIEQMTAPGLKRLIISKPAGKSEPYQKLTVEPIGQEWQISSYTDKQVFHENLPLEDLARRCAELVQGHFLQVNGWSEGWEHMLLLSKKGKCTYKRKRLPAAGGCGAGVCPAPADSGHNRKKNYLIPEGADVPPLVDMGIFTREGRVVRSMYDKYRQINRFLEVLDDEIGKLGRESINVIDFGCSKSYLTFVVYHYLTAVRGMKANIIGLDLKADVIEKCGEAARKYGYEGLRFELGDINGYQAPFPVDMVITLHACDTATDFALYNAIRWGAGLIFSVPCCQHELNGQIESENLAILTRYGILKERFSAIATDAIRGDLLEYCGYKTQLLEFIDFAHTPKNILIRAVKRPTTPKEVKKRALAEVRALMQEFHFDPTLYRMLGLAEEGEESQ